MKKLLFFLLLSTVFLSSYAQTASRLLVSQSTPQGVSRPNYLWVDTGATGMYRIWSANMDSLKLKPVNISWLNDSVISIGNQRYVLLSGTYSNPSFVNTLSATKVFGLSSVALTGDYNDLTNKPNLSLLYPYSNPLGFISGASITSSFLNGVYGYTPYPDSNPNGYITQDNVYNAGPGINKVGTEPSATFTADTTMLMTVSRATDSIASIVGMVGNKQNYSDTLSWDATKNYVLTRGFLTGINSTQVISALGYTPLQPSDTTNKWYPRNSNPNGYLTTVTSGQINSALGYTPLSPSDTISLSNRINLKLNISDTTGKWKNASYSPSSSEITTGLGFTPVPNTRTLTINGTTQDLSANRTWTIPVNTYTAGYGLALNTNQFRIDSTQIMTVSRATDSITNINTKVNGKVDNSRTLTINGVAQDLSANRTWVVGNDTVSLSNRINTKLNISDTTGKWISNINLTTIGTTGAATWNSGTKTLNIPVYNSGVTINSNVSRSLSNAAGTTNQFTISTTQNATVYYSLNVAWSITALLSTSSTILLEYSTNGGSSWIIANQVSKNVNLGLVQSGNDDLNVSGEIPANALVRIRPSVATNATITYIRGQEKLY